MNNAAQVAQTKIVTINAVIVLAEKYWETNTEDHPIFTNDLYDHLEDAKMELYMANRPSTLCSNLSALASANVD